MKIILIGGTPRTGKTTLARKIAKEKSISWVSTDALESIVYSCIPKEKQANLFPKSVMRRRTNRNNDEFYATYSISKIIHAYFKQADSVSEAIQALVDYASKEDVGYVIEGYHVTPALVSKLRDKQTNFSSVILVNSNPMNAIERSKNSNVKSDWIRDNTQKEETFESIANMLTEFSRRISTQAKTHKVQVVDMAIDFETKFDTTYVLLTK